MSAGHDNIIVPRPFKLRLEFDAASGKKVRPFSTNNNEDTLDSSERIYHFRIIH